MTLSWTIRRDAWGMKLPLFNPDDKYKGSPTDNFKYNGKEYMADLGYYEYGFRIYDPTTARFTAVDRFSEKYNNNSVYVYAGNNPILNVDINGDSTFVSVGNDGNFNVVGGNLDNPKDRGVYMKDKGDSYQFLGNTITSNSFFDDEGNAVIGATIDLWSSEGQDFLDNEIIKANPNLTFYMENATGGELYDFKTRNIESKPDNVTHEQYSYRGSVTSGGLIGSARDFGNIGAGVVAGRSGMSWTTARAGFDALQKWQDKSWTAVEGITTQRAQLVGFRIGVSLR